MEGLELNQIENKSVSSVYISIYDIRKGHFNPDEKINEKNSRGIQFDETIHAGTNSERSRTKKYNEDVM